MDQHIEITATNHTNGNIQYVYHDEQIHQPYTEPKNIVNDNVYAPLTILDQNTDSQAERDLSSILTSDNSTELQQQKPDIYNQALDNATSTLKKLSDFLDQKPPPTPVKINNNQFSENLKKISDESTLAFKLHINHLVTEN